MSTSTSIHKATLNDLDELADLFNLYRVFYKKESDVEAGKSFLQERITQNESEIFVACHPSGRLAGFVQLYPLFTSTNLKRTWLLNDLFVHADFRGLGVSKLLIEAAKELCKSTNAFGLTLETDASNIEGNNLYPKTGFTLDDHNFYYWINPNK